MERPENKPLNLRSLHKSVFWAPEDGLIAKLRDNPETTLAQLSEEEKVHLVKELDRRMAQLWEKVQFERKHELVDYQPLGTPS